MARAQGRTRDLPVRISRGEVPHVRVALALVILDGRVLVRRRPAGGLLGGMWELPSWELEGGSDPVGDDVQRAVRTVHDRLRVETGTGVLSIRPLGRVGQTYSHKRWDVTVYRVRYANEEVELAKSGVGKSESEVENVLASTSDHYRDDVIRPGDVRWTLGHELACLGMPRVFRTVLDRFVRFDHKGRATWAN